SASVVVPRSYFVSLYKRASRKDIEPDDALLAPIVSAHLVKIRGLVKNSLGVSDDEDVSVEVYDDAAPTPVPVASAGAPAAASVVPVAASSLSLGAQIDRQIVYGLLGVTMLLAIMVLRRRPRAVTPVVAPVTRVATHPRHEHSLADNPIDGDDEIEAHDMFRRVRDVVEENPEEAARVLRSWIYQGR